MVTYNIDTVENGYTHFNGNSLKELKQFLYSNGVFMDCCGIIEYSSESSILRLSIAANKEYGVYLGFSNSTNNYLSLANVNKLEETIDVWGDDLLVSIGLFIAPKIAWEGICEFITQGTMCKKIEWLNSENLPDGGNYI